MSRAMPPDSEPTYSERLYVSPGVWIGTLTITLVVAMQLALVLPFPVYATSGAMVLLASLALAAAGTAQVTVAGGEISAAGERMSCAQIASVEELDARNTRAALGRAGDPAATVATRPWVRTSVKVVAVHDDPPYLLVSSRHPERLTAALVACASQAAVQ